MEGSGVRSIFNSCSPVVSTGMSIWISANRVLAGTSSGDTEFPATAGIASISEIDPSGFLSTIEKPEKLSSESFGSVFVEPDHVTRHRQAGTNQCRIR